ncbi:aminopeptidase N [Desulfobacter vibrioformis]|uniref:aminopeptidase N n=1 Tax=Desulfobacter vibrioformis TaxID=34031 RepID=UPI00055616CF|nr:aminopeptidase N [Desulfobacter vibrioformis]
MNEHKKIYLKDYRPFEFIVDHVDLIFDIRDDHTRVISKLKMRKDPARADETTPLVLNKGIFDIVSVVAGDMVLLPGEYQSDDETFTLAATPDVFELEITNILKPDENTALEGLYRSGSILCTQCEAQGFRNITPYPDRPDVMAPFSCTIVADKTRYPVLLSNGNPVKSGDLDNNRHFVVWEDPFKKPCYLFALVAGDLAVLEDQFTTASGRHVTLNIYSEKENIALCSHAMTSLKQAMAWDENRFGREYDLDLYQIVAINDFNAGAMENKGLNIFNAKYVLADPQTATDDDFMGIQGVIAHEYFHNWTGNRITLKNWFQLSLKEGLTVFRDQEFSSDMNSRPVKRISDVKNLMAAQFPEDSGPMTHPVRPDSYIKMDNFYTMTVYEKGAEVIRMIYQLLGQDLFRKGMDLYFEKFDGMAVTLEDFVDVMEKVSGRSLDQFFLWYTQSGTPEVSMTRQYDETTGTLSLTFTQATSPDRNQSEKKPFHIPVRISLINRTGETVKQDLLYELTKEIHTFRFENISADIYPSVFREFTAPVRLTTDFSDQDLAFLMARDTDPFNQWRAAQTLFINEIKNLVTAVRTGGPMTVSAGLVQAFSLALEDKEKDRAFLSKTLALPLETEIKDHFEIIDVEAIHQARTFLKQTLAEKLASQFKTVYDICRSAPPADISGAAMADRSLKNLCLSYLGCLSDKDIQDLVQKQFESAGNMTDEFAAFKILSHKNPEMREKACHAFYDKWKARTLVIDKWFSVQAQSSLNDTLDQVKKLTVHKDFTMANPNKVRALIFAFAMNNPMNFHRADGQGYAFVAERILALDKINHQTAARLCACFNLWKRYDQSRQVMMKKQLETMAGQKELSRNLYEIVSRALE